MLIIQSDRDELINKISEFGAFAIKMLQIATENEVSHPSTYTAGYLQGYIHGCDDACEFIAHCDKWGTPK